MDQRTSRAPPRPLLVQCKPSCMPPYPRLIHVMHRFRKRDEKDTISYSTEAILCGDSIDLTSTNMTDVFQNIIATSQNISHMCKLSPVSFDESVISVSGLLMPNLCPVAAAWPFASYYCATWPVRAVERYQGPFNNTLANRVLVIGNTVSSSIASPLRPAKG